MQRFCVSTPIGDGPAICIASRASSVGTRYVRGRCFFRDLACFRALVQLVIVPSLRCQVSQALQKACRLKSFLEQFG